MATEDELFDIEQGFWLSGKEHFIAHLDDQCLLAFPQAGEMHGVFSAEHVAATATPSNRWRDLRMTDRHLLRADGQVAIISYRADVTRPMDSPIRHWSVRPMRNETMAGSCCSTSIPLSDVKRPPRI